MRALLILLLLLPYFATGQTAQQIVTSRNYVYPARPQYIPMLLGTTTQIYKTSVDSITIGLKEYVDSLELTNAKKDSISLVGFTGKYNDLLNKPTIPSNTNQLTNGAGFITKTDGDGYYKAISYVPGWSEITGKPSFFSGDYNDLTNKPSLFSGDYDDLTNKPSLATVATSGSYNDLTNKPTIPSAQVNSDWNATSGVAQILNKPTIKRIETYTGTTNASGLYSVTYTTAFSSKPKVIVTYEGSNNKNNVFVSSSTTTGFTITATQYNAINALGIEVLAGAPTALTGATVNVIVIE